MNHQKRHEILRSLRTPVTADFRDENPIFSSDLIEDVSCLHNSGVFLKLGSNDTVLVNIEEIELYRDPDDFVFVGKLLGNVVWGSKIWKRAEIDKTKQLEHIRCTPVKTFDNLLTGFPNTDWQFYLERLRLREVKANGYNLLALAEVKGADPD